MRIGVFGAGGVGGYLAGRLAQAGREVVLIARGPHLQAIQRDGLHVQSIAGDFVTRNLLATNAPASAGRVDAVFVCVKAWQVPDAAVALRPMLGPDSVAIPLENGVDAADQLAAVLGIGRVLGGVCRIASVRKGPGQIRHGGLSPEVEFGELDGRRTPRVAALLAAFDGVAGLSARVADDIRVSLWEKFLFIAPVGGVGAATRVSIDEFRGVPETREMLEAAMREVVQLARARGVVLPAGALERTLRFVDGLPARATSSMQRDLMEGRPSELEAQIGAVVRMARSEGLAVPVSECLYRCLLPAELRARGSGTGADGR